MPRGADKRTQVLGRSPDRDRDLPPSVRRVGEPEAEGALGLRPSVPEPQPRDCDAGYVAGAEDLVVVHAHVHRSLDVGRGAGLPQPEERCHGQPTLRYRCIVSDVTVWYVLLPVRPQRTWPPRRRG